MKTCHIYKEKFENKYLKDKKYRNVRDHCYYTGEYTDAVDSLCNLKNSVPKKISIIFHNGYNYDYHFIIKELVEEFKRKFTCLGENTEKYITFIVPIEKEVMRVDKNGEEITKIYLTYYNLLIQQESASSLSNLVNYLSEGFYRIKCKYRHGGKKCETCGIK